MAAAVVVVVVVVVMALSAWVTRPVFAADEEKEANPQAGDEGGDGDGDGDDDDGGGEDEEARAREEWPPGGPRALLHNGVEMPLIGAGLAGMKGDETRKSMRLSVAAGFRHFDGAQSKEWYDDVSAGDELAKIMAESPEGPDKLKREDFFLVSKVHPTFLGHDKAVEAVAEMLQSWKTDYMDLVLLHYPECGSWIPDCKDATGGDWRGAWRALEEKVDNGTIRAIGVSNFNVRQMEELWDWARIKPHVVQMWMDPFHQARDEYEFAVTHDAFVVSYSSLGTQWYYGEIGRNLVFENPVLHEIAEKRDASVPVVVLSWLLAKRPEPVGVIPRSTDERHIADNARLLDGSFWDLLEEDDVDKIDNLDGMFDVWPPEDCVRHREHGECDPKAGMSDVAENCKATCVGMDSVMVVGDNDESGESESGDDEGEGEAAAEEAESAGSDSESDVLGAREDL